MVCAKNQIMSDHFINGKTQYKTKQISKSTTLHSVSKDGTRKEESSS